MFKLIILFVSLMVILLSGCVPITLTGSGNVVTQEEPITGFDSVDISHSFNVDISQGESFSVVIRIDDNLIEHLHVVKQGDTLKIGLDPNRDFNIQNATMEAKVTIPELTGLDLSGSSDANITGFISTKNLTVDLSGSSSLVGDIEAGDISIDLSGSSDLTLAGSGGDMTIDISGSSDLDMAELPAVDARVSASGSSSAIVNASGRLDVDASGASDVYYLGDPSLGTISISGSSTIQPK
jgi:hypothetical protein